MYGLTSSSVDQCIYFNFGTDRLDDTILGLWVDDLLIATRTAERGAMTCGPTDRFMGFEITRDRLHRTIYISQPT